MAKPQEPQSRLTASRLRGNPVQVWLQCLCCVSMVYALSSCGIAVESNPVEHVIVPVEETQPVTQENNTPLYTNDLEHAQSPYLKQHAHNPVQWVEWSAAAFAEAKKRDVPVIISIGYSTCHWCHVMAHESFEDPETAALMNEHFVCIKVDREEHPEVDEIYMDTVQALTGRGGWPLNAVVDHEGRPFFAGTYYPKPQWQSLLRQFTQVWTTDRPRINRAATDITAHLEKMSARTAAPMVKDQWQTLVQQCLQSYDNENPGFGQPQPKFPASQLLPLLLAYRGVESEKLHVMAESILEAMQDGGIHDRVGGGFHRYSVDAQWRVPHFEKMLYDNAQLMGVYALASVQCQRPDFMDTAKNIAEYILRDLRITDENGVFLGFASAEDADDPGGEGSFYAWSLAELEAALGKDVAMILQKEWNLSTGKAEIGRSGHAEPVASHIPQPRAYFASASLTTDEKMALREKWQVYLPALRAHRDQRARPSLDDKILTDLNALALRGFSLLARYSGDERYAQAVSELSLVLEKRFTDSGLIRFGNQAAFITDYGHLLVGLTDAFMASGEPHLIHLAERVGTEAVERLRAEDGGFYTTPAGRDDLIRRSREDTDNAYPSGIHCLALGFVRLASITGEEKWADYAGGIFQIQSNLASRAPTACATLLMAYLEYQRGHMSAVLIGAADDLAIATLRAATLKNTIAGLVPLRMSALQDESWPALEGRKELTDLAVLVCVDQRCLQPGKTVDDFQALLKQLEKEID